MTIQPTRYIPENAEAITRDGLNAVVYYYTSRQNKPCAIAYKGRRSKADYHYSYRTEDSRDDAANKFFDGWEEYEALKGKRRKKRSQAHTLKVGDILVCSWGYGQTNVDFYQVLSRTNCYIKMMRIESQATKDSAGFLCDKCVAVPDAFIKNAKLLSKKVWVQTYPNGDEHQAVTMNSYSTAQVWDGLPEHRSWCH